VHGTAVLIRSGFAERAADVTALRYS